MEYDIVVVNRKSIYSCCAKVLILIVVEYDIVGVTGEAYKRKKLVGS